MWLFALAEYLVAGCQAAFSRSFHAVMLLREPLRRFISNPVGSSLASVMSSASDNRMRHRYAISVQMGEYQYGEAAAIGRQLG